MRSVGFSIVIFITITWFITFFSGGDELDVWGV